MVHLPSVHVPGHTVRTRNTYWRPRKSILVCANPRADIHAAFLRTCRVACVRESTRDYNDNGKVCGRFPCTRSRKRSFARAPNHGEISHEIAVAVACKGSNAARAAFLFPPPIGADNCGNNLFRHARWTFVRCTEKLGYISIMKLYSARNSFFFFFLQKKGYFDSSYS